MTSPQRSWLAIGAALGLVAVLLLSRTGFEIRHTIDIDAPPERVWAAIVDFPGYAAWNTQLAYLGGDLRLGGELHLRLSAEGASPYTFKPVISHLEEGRRFAWLARTGIPRLFDGEHFFELERPNVKRHAVWDGWAVRRENHPGHVRDFPGRRWLFSQSHLVFALRKLQLERQQVRGARHAGQVGRES